MDNSHTLIFALGSILGTLAQLAVIIACIILVNKQRNAATVVMLVASILSLLFSFLGFVSNLIAARQSAESVLQWSKVTAIIVPLPYILFSIGLLMYVVNHVRKQASSQ